MIENVNSNESWVGLDRNSIIDHIPSKFHRGGPCLPGGKRLFVNCDGCFYPCERVSEATEVAQIGNINDGFDLKKVNTLLNLERVTADVCKVCWAYYYCDICVTKADDKGEISADFIKKHCKDVREKQENDFRDYCVFKQILEGKYIDVGKKI